MRLKIRVEVLDRELIKAAARDTLRSLGDTFDGDQAIKDGADDKHRAFHVLSASNRSVKRERPKYQGGNFG